VVNGVGFFLLAFSTWPAGSASVLSQHYDKIVSVYLLGGLLTCTNGPSRKIEINFSFTLYLN